MWLHVISAKQQLAAMTYNSKTQYDHATASRYNKTTIQQHTNRYPSKPNEGPHICTAKLMDVPLRTNADDKRQCCPPGRQNSCTTLVSRCSRLFSNIVTPIIKTAYLQANPCAEPRKTLVLWALCLSNDLYK